MESSRFGGRDARCACGVQRWIEWLRGPDDRDSVAAGVVVDGSGVDRVAYVFDEHDVSSDDGGTDDIAGANDNCGSTGDAGED